MVCCLLVRCSCARANPLKHQETEFLVHGYCESSEACTRAATGWVDEFENVGDEKCVRLCSNTAAGAMRAEPRFIIYKHICSAEYSVLHRQAYPKACGAGNAYVRALFVTPLHSA